MYFHADELPSSLCLLVLPGDQPRQEVSVAKINVEEIKSHKIGATTNRFHYLENKLDGKTHFKRFNTY